MFNLEKNDINVRLFYTGSILKSKLFRNFVNK